MYFECVVCKERVGQGRVELGLVKVSCGLGINLIFLYLKLLSLLHALHLAHIGKGK